MHLGPRTRRTSLSLVASVVVAPAMTGCGLLDGGSTLEEAFEVLPADTYRVEFTDRARMAERLELDEIDPRDVSDEDVADYTRALEDVGWGSTWTQYLSVMKDAPVNEFDVEWSARASWGDPEEPGGAEVFKVGDEVDFDELADDLRDLGYDGSEDGGRLTFSIDDLAEIGEHYPPGMLNVLLDEDERLVVTAFRSDSIEQITDVITDDADSLADDGGFEQLADVAEEDPEHAQLSRADAVCPGPIASSARDATAVQEQYGDLGRPEARALLVSGDEPDAVIALQFADEDAARDDLSAREELISDGVDPQTRQPFDELGDFELEQDGEIVVVTTDFADGPRVAAAAEQRGTGPGYCLPE